MRNGAYESSYHANRRQTVARHHNGGSATALLSAEKTIYDGLGRPVTEQAGTAFSGTSVTAWQTVRSLTYTPVGQVLTESNGAGNTTTSSYDAMDRLLQVEDPVGRKTRFTVDLAGQTLKEMRAYGTALQQDYATYTYSNNGQRLTVKDAHGNQTDYQYDGHDRLRFTYFPHPMTGAHCTQPGTAAGTPSCASGQTYERYDLDAHGNRTGLRGRDGQVIGYEFDALNRQTKKTIPGASTSDVYSKYDLAGRPQWLKFASTSGEGIVYGYDSAKRLTSETSFGRAVSYQYDVGGNRTRLTWPDANYIQYTYDALNRMDQVRENGATSGAGLLADYGYDALSRRTTLARGNGTAASFGYDLASRLTGLTQDFASTSQDLVLALTYTAASQLETRSSAQGLFDHGGPLVNRSYAANKLNQYSSVGGTVYTYDAKGNLTSDGSRSFGYDVENRLTSVSGSASLALTYDPLGRLRQTTQGSTVTQFLYDGDRLIAEYDGSGNVLRRYAHGAGVDEPITWYEGASLTADRRTLHADERGSILATSNASGVATPYTYGPYGEPATWSGPRFRYTGQAALPEVQLYHYKARVYDPLLGRFLQTDPIGYRDDLNLYAYAYNDPLNLTDPNGLCGTLIKGATSANCKSVDVASGDSEADEHTQNRRALEADLGINPAPRQAFEKAAEIGSDVSDVASELAEDTLLGGPAGLLVRWLKVARGLLAAKWTLGSGKSATKWANQMSKRGWNERQIGEALNTKGIPARNAVNPNNPATRHIHPETGQSLVIDNKTNEIIHVGGKNFDYSDWDLLP